MTPYRLLIYILCSTALFLPQVSFATPNITFHPPTANGEAVKNSNAQSNNLGGIPATQTYSPTKNKTSPANTTIKTSPPEFKLEVYRYGNKKSKNVYLTFDDGPDPQYTELVLKVLRRHKIKATFFLVGTNVKKNPQIAADILKEGHTLGNHTYQHHNLSKLNPEEIAREIDRTQAEIKKATGIWPKLFRPPYGSFNDSVLAVAEKKQLKVVLWSVDPEDYLLNREDKLVHKVLNHLKDGCIILLHDNSRNTIEALESLIELTGKHNYQFASLDASLKGESSRLYYTKKYIQQNLAMAEKPTIRPDTVKPLLKVNLDLKLPKPEKQNQEEQERNKELKIDRTYVIKLAEDSDLLLAVKTAVKNNKIKYGRIEAMGSVKQAAINYYRPDTKRYSGSNIYKSMELITCIGSITPDSAANGIRLQATLADTAGIIGGRITKGTIMVNGELIIQSYVSK